MVSSASHIFLPFTTNVKEVQIQGIWEWCDLPALWTSFSRRIFFIIDEMCNFIRTCRYNAMVHDSIWPQSVFLFYGCALPAASSLPDKGPLCWSWRSVGVLHTECSLYTDWVGTEGQFNTNNAALTRHLRLQRNLSDVTWSQHHR